MSDQVNAYGADVDVVFEPIESNSQEFRPAITKPDLRIVAADFIGDLPSQYGLPPRLTVVFTDQNEQESDALYIHHETVFWKVKDAINAELEKRGDDIGHAFRSGYDDGFTNGAMNAINRFNSMSLWDRIVNVFQPMGF